MKISLDKIDFEKEMRRIREEVARLANQEIREKIIFATEQLRIVTPVDKGRARAGWRYEIEQSGFRNTFQGGSIINQVEYIERLNRGHSKQAPAYFIEQTLNATGILTP